MKLIIAGAGGVGAYVGARLQRDAGAEVILLARGNHLVELQKNGLTLIRDGHTSNLKMTALDSSEELSRCKDADWILFACKTQDTEKLATTLKPLLSERTHICSLQNGVDNEVTLQRVLERPPVGGICMGFGAHLQAPGILEVNGRDGLIFGEYPLGSSTRVEALATLCEQAGFQVRISENIQLDLWKKLVMNAGCNPLSALLDKNSRQLVDDERSARLVKNIMREAAAAAAADGVEFTPKDLEEMYQMFFQIDPIRSSMQVDAQRGTPLELTGITGAVLDRSSELGIQAPVTSTLEDLLRVKYNCR